MKYKQVEFSQSSYVRQEAEAHRLMLEKSAEMFGRLDALGVKYSVFQDCIEIDAPEDKLEAVQNVLREMWPSGVVGE